MLAETRNNITHGAFRHLEVIKINIIIFRKKSILIKLIKQQNDFTDKVKSGCLNIIR